VCVCHGIEFSCWLTMCIDLCPLSYCTAGVWYEDDPDQSKPDEKFFNARRSGEMEPGAWRMMTVQLDFIEKSLRLYLDGRLVMDSLKGLKRNPLFNYPIPSWAQVSDFGRSFIRFDSCERQTGPDFSRNVDSINFRVAAIRLYQHVLTEAEISKIHLDSRWTQGGKMRQVRFFVDECVGT
jgi:hypothetical protein